MIAAGNQGKIYLIEMTTYEHKEILYGHEDSINCLVIEEFILFSGSDDFTIRLWVNI